MDDDCMTENKNKGKRSSLFSYDNNKL